MADPRWVLAYSEQCGTCTRVADSIAELATGRLEIRGLLDPDVVDWRRATGHADDWQPILFLLSDGAPKAFVGRGMAWRLARRLGLRRASEVARLVAGLQDTPTTKAGSSRRQFIRKAALGAASLAGVGLLGRLPVAAKGSGAGNGTAQLRTQRALHAGDALLNAAFASAQLSLVAKTHGRNAFGDAVHTTFADTDIEAVAVALKPSSGPARSVFAYFRPGNTSDFKVFQLEIVQEGAAASPSQFSGYARALAHDESLIGSAVYRNGQVVSTTTGAATAVAGGAIPYAEDWGCVGNCIQYLWPHLPWYVQLACGAVCAGCLTGIWLACFPCVGCLAGYAALCMKRCWY